MTREDIEKYGKILDNKESREFLGIEENGGAYKIMGDSKFLMYTGRLGAIRYIKQFYEMLQEMAKKPYNKTKEE